MVDAFADFLLLERADVSQRPRREDEPRMICN